MLCAAAWMVDRAESRNREDAQRAHVGAEVAGVSKRLETALNQRIHLARGLEALVMIRPEIGQAEFAAYAHVLRTADPAIRSLQLARGGIVSHIDPEEGNRAALGHSLLADPAVAESALEALESRSMRVAGPYTLRQGGQGIVARLPIFVETGAPGGEFWGFATVLIDVGSLLQASGMQGMPDLRLALRGKDGKGAGGEVFFGPGELFSADSSTAAVHFPSGHWIVAAQPAEGWSHSWPGRPWLLATTALLLAAIPATIVGLRRKGAARDEADRLRLRERLLTSLGEGVYGIDVQGRCTFINPAALQMLGLAREEAIGRDAHALFNGPVPNADGNRGEERLRRRDGSSFAAQVTVAPLEAGQGWVVVFSDDTERRHAQERLRLAASVFAHTQQGIMITDAAGTLVDVNPAFTEITGYSREEVVGRSPKILSSGRQTPEFYAALKRSVAETGYWRGEIWNRHRSGRAYPEQLGIAAVHGEDGRVSHYIGTFSDISRQKQHEAELTRIAHYDPLTGLPNRTLLTDRLAQGVDAARHARNRAAVGMLDLDRFKAVNDRYGHDVGDAVLIEVGHRLKGAMRSGDTVGRFGGDEFVLLMANVDDVTTCEALAHRLLKALAAPVEAEGLRVDISASLGLTISPDDDASDAETLLRHADQAMYAAKLAGGARYRLFDPEQDRQARTHRATIERIAQGIGAGEFRLHYQPKVDMRAGRVLGFEALVRWQHPDEGLLGPDRFLATVAGTDLDAALGRWILRESLAQLADWRAMGLSFGLSVNVSGTHLLAPGFVEELSALLHRHPSLERGAVEIEVLETAALADIDAASSVLHRCLELGVSAALDDFGTGYSSLAYFRRLPVRTLKIDQSFVRDLERNPEDRAIVEGIVRFARAFSREIVAEGVESPELCAPLLAMGCEVGQGYGIARPMPPERVPEWTLAFRAPAEWAAHATGSAQVRSIR